jgi:hypothetical protein
MIDWPPLTSEQRAVFEILDRAKLLLAHMLPGCTARRYDFFINGDYSPIELCFGEKIPVVPKLALYPSKYYDMARSEIYYILMLRDPRTIGNVSGYANLRTSAPLDSGPEAIASTIRDAISKVDLAAIISAGSVERILAESGRLPVPSPNLYLALCATYLKRYQEAHMLLQDNLRFAREDGRPGVAGVMAEAEDYLMKLEFAPDAFRQEVVAVMDANWAHFKIVG